MTVLAMNHLLNLFLFALCLVEASGQTRPNFVYFLAESWGYNDVGYHDNTINTPAITQLARDGIIIENNYVTPICAPSRAALLTGRYPFHIGYQDGNPEDQAPICLTREHPILPEALKALGYNTYMVGKWHLGFCNEECTPTHRGFDKFYGFLGGRIDYYTHENRGYYDSYDDLDPATCDYGQYFEHLSRHHALEYINSHVSENSSKGNPFFMYFNFQTVHTPSQVPEEYLQRHLDEADPDRRAIKAMISVADDTIGNIVQLLKDKEIYNNTIIIFSADHGGTNGRSLNSPLRGVGLASAWEGRVRVPGFVHSPLLKQSSGTVTHGLFHITDWFPTIISLAGGNVPNYVDGYNQRDFILNGGPSKRNLVPIHYTQAYPPTYGAVAVRKGEWKLIKATDEFLNQSLAEGHLIAENNILLFDLEDDPNETTNVACKYPDVVEELDELLQSFADTAVEVSPNWRDVSPQSNPELRDWVWGPGWC